MKLTIELINTTGKASPALHEFITSEGFEWRYDDDGIHRYIQECNQQTLARINFAFIFADANARNIDLKICNS